MATIREDVVSISFDVENNPFAELTAQMDEVKQSVTGGVNDANNELKKLANGAETAGDGLDELAKTAKGLNDAGTESLKDSVSDTAKESKKAGLSFKNLGQSIENSVNAKTGFDKVKTSVEKIKNVKLSDIGNGLKKGLNKGVDESKKLFTNLKQVAGVGLDKVTNGVKSLATNAGKAAATLGSKLAKGVVAGVGAATTAVGGLLGASVKSYADYEQLTGGVETLFKNSAPQVQKYANDAYKTAGLSANAYMDTVTAFSASLLQSVGGNTQKAAEMSNMAVTDMADNANKMGTSMDMVIETYQSLAKGNYAMLDNLKLGYGGTKKEMQRLIKDAAKLDSSVDANSMSYGNVVKALHAVQTNMGITGTTAKEAATTISGSFASLKSAWGNMLPALIQGGDSFDQCMNNLVESAATFGKNVMPAIKSALTGVSQLVAELAPMIAAEIPGLIVTILPQLVNAAVSMVNSLISAIQANVGSLASAATSIVVSIVNCIITALPQLIIVGAQLILSLVQGVSQQLPTLVPTFVNGLLGLVNSLLGMIPQIITAGMQLIIGLAQGIMNAIPTLMQSAPMIITTLINCIVGYFPQLIQLALQLVNTLVQ